MASDSPPSPAVAGRDIPNPTIHGPPWLNNDDPTAEIYSSSPYPLSGVSVTSDVTSPNIPYYLNEALPALRRYPSSNKEGSDPDPEFDLDPDSPAYSSDHFRMFECKVRPCALGGSHEGAKCPFAHPGEKRRDPRKFHYSGSACPDFRKGHCKKGDSCEFAHGVYECFLHPERYRTKPCNYGTICTKGVCFLAHTPEQLRVLPQQSPRGSNSVNSSMESYDGSPMRQAMEQAMESYDGSYDGSPMRQAKGMPFLSASPDISPGNSPPMSPISRSVSRWLGSSEMVASLRKVKSLPTSWNDQVGSVGSVGSPEFVSPRGSMLRPRFCSLPSTPTHSTVGFLDFCDEGCEEEVPLERVESGRDLRAKIFERLREENSQEEGTGIGFGSPVSMGGTPVLPPVNERGHNLPDIDSASLPISMGGTSVFHNVEAGRICSMLGLLAGICRLESLNISMGGTPVIQTGNVEGSRIRRMLAGIGLASPISTGDSLVIQTGDVEAGHLLTGSRFGVGRTDITPMNNDFRMYFGNAEPQTDNFHLVRPLEQRSRSNCFFILFVTSEILGVVFEIIYQESHIMAYFFIWFVCAMIAMYVAHVLAKMEGGMTNREQYAVYFRCFSFLLLEPLQYWGIHQGNYVIALKIILKVMGAVIGWWVGGVLQSYMDAFGMHLPLRRRDD